MAHTVESLLATWVSLVDTMFSQPFVDAGEGGGLEVWTQAMAQLARVSEAIENTAASLYLQPYSGQAAPSAQGGARARVVIDINRTVAFQFPLYMDPTFAVEELTTNPTTLGGEVVSTGRVYNFREGVCLFPGQAGPVWCEAEAEAMGGGYNAPLAESLTGVVQPGKDARGDYATVFGNAGFGDGLYAENAQGGFLHGHVGQYVQVLNGLNAGKVRRVVAYVPPDITPVVHGGAVTLAHDVVVNVSAVVGVFAAGDAVEWTLGKGRLLAFNGTQMLIHHESGYFQPGGIASDAATATVDSVEHGSLLVALHYNTGLYPTGWVPGDVITQANTNAEGSYVATEGDWVLVAPTFGSFNAVDLLTGSVSTFTCVPDALAYDPRLASESNVTWKVLDWDADFGVVVSNALAPTGGRFPVLDELMRDRGIQRNNQETDESLVKRGTMTADVVSPNAIRRAIARHYPGGGWEFHEVGTANWPGFFYDVPASEAAASGYACAYDMTTTESRYSTLLGYDEFRAFFLIGLPRLGTGEFGFAYDAGPANAWDCGFFDGYAVQECALRQQLWNDIVARKAAGVGFDFYLVQ